MDVFLFSSCTLIYALFANLAESILEYSSLLLSGVSFFTGGHVCEVRADLGSLVPLKFLFGFVCLICHYSL